MIIDCHGHYTTAPGAHQKFRDAQIAALKDPTAPAAKPGAISDDEIRETIEKNQLRLQKQRGSDLTLFSPRASAMGHHLGNEAISSAWTRANNDLIKRVVDLYPENFVGVCQLPQSPGVPIANSVAELERCIRELNFVGCNLNPDPSGGHWTAPPLTDRHWYPFYEKMVELDVPAMIHVSASCNPNFHATGAHYINADTTAFMQFIEGDLFRDFPPLRFIIPHGGGAVPYVRVIDIGNILFGSELVGAVRGIDPRTGHYFDDTRRYIDALSLSAAEKERIYEKNARRVFPRLDALLKVRGL